VWWAELPRILHEEKEQGNRGAFLLLFVTLTHLKKGLSKEKTKDRSCSLCDPDSRRWAGLIQGFECWWHQSA
jgi:hypothetical protein